MIHHDHCAPDGHLSVRATNLALAPVWVCHERMSPCAEKCSPFGPHFTFHLSESFVVGYSISGCPYYALHPTHYALLVLSLWYFPSVSATLSSDMVIGLSCVSPYPGLPLATHSHNANVVKSNPLLDQWCSDFPQILRSAAVLFPRRRVKYSRKMVKCL